MTTTSATDPASPVSTNLDQSFGGHEKDDFIQIWRGIAAVIVIYYHFSNRVPFTAMGSSAPPMLEFYTGKLGVMAFFAISGYLITKSLVASRNLASFYAKRLARIWPLFIVACVTIFVTMHFLSPPVVVGGAKPFDGATTSWVDLFATLFFLNDLGFQFVDGVFWSILVELKFYFWIGLLAVLVPRKFVAVFATVAFLGGSAELLCRLADDPSLKTVTWLLNGVLLAEHASFFAIGALLFTGRDRTLLTLNLLLASGQMAYKISENPDFSVHGTIIFALVIAGIIALDAVLLRKRLFLMLGDYSYAWYLFHQLIGLGIIRMVTPQIGIDAAIAVALVTTLGIAIVFSKLAEWRFRHAFYTAINAALTRIGLDRAKLGKEARTG